MVNGDSCGDDLNNDGNDGGNANPGGVGNGGGGGDSEGKGNDAHNVDRYGDGVRAGDDESTAVCIARLHAEDSML